LAGISRVCNTSGRRKKIALEVEETHGASLEEFFPRLDLLRQQPAPPSPVAFYYGLPLCPTRALEIHFENVNESDHRFPRVILNKIIEGNRVASKLQALAGFKHQGIHLDALENFDHSLSCRQKRDVIFEQHVAGAVEESSFAVAQHVQSHQQGNVQRAAGSSLEIWGTKKILHSVPEEKFIAEHLLLPGQDGLARNEAEFASVRNPRRMGELCGLTHFRFIGNITRNLYSHRTFSINLNTSRAVILERSEGPAFLRNEDALPHNDSRGLDYTSSKSAWSATYLLVPGSRRHAFVLCSNLLR
jgi:hypothetical protein